MAKGNSRGLISAIDLFHTVREKVSTSVSQELKKQQAPVMVTGGNGASVIVGEPTLHSN